MTDPALKLRGIRNFYAYSDELVSGGQPQADQFHLIREAGFTRIINLACDDSPGALPDEPSLVNELGLDYLHIPVNFRDPQMENLVAFCRAMQAQPATKTFVHCAYNWRVSCFIYLYRTLCCGISTEIARRDLHNVWHPDPVWEEFMHHAEILHSDSELF